MFGHPSSVVMHLTITVNASLKSSKWPQIEEDVSSDEKRGDMPPDDHTRYSCHASQ